MTWQRRKGRAGQVLRAEPQQDHEAGVRDLHALAVVDHADTERHVAQRRIEARGQRAQLVVGGQRVEQQRLKPHRHRAQRGEEWKGEQRQRGVPRVALGHPAQAERSGQARRLHGSDTRAAEITARDGGGAADGDDGGQKVSEGVVRAGQAQKAPQANDEAMHGRPEAVAPFPARQAVGAKADGHPRVVACHEHEAGGDDDDQQAGAGPQARHPRADGGHGDRDGCRDAAEDERPPILEQGRDEEGVHFRRKCPLGSLLDNCQPLGRPAIPITVDITSEVLTIGRARADKWTDIATRPAAMRRFCITGQVVHPASGSGLFGSLQPLSSR